MSEVDNSSNVTGLPQLSAQAWELYRRALKGERITLQEPGFDELDSMGLLIPEPFRPGLHVPTELAHVESQLRTLAEQRLATAVSFMSGIRSLLESVEEEQHRHGGPAGDLAAVFIEGIDAVHKVMAPAVDAARSEVLTAQPGKRKPELLAASAPRDIALIERGVSMRIVYNGSNQGDAAARQYANSIISHGGHIRTMEAPIMKMIIVDNDHAFVPDFAEGRAPEVGAWHMRHPAMVGFVRAAFEDFWQRSTPWGTTGPSEQRGASGDSQATSEPVTTPVLRSILRGIVAGLSHRQIGDQLGISERTVTTHLSGLRTNLGLATIPQLTFWWAESDERKLI
ncbi:LuxR C-terminal-related transcriptional regulator [Streptomyces sp. NPDC005283]|uniref:LuxR C-terminal-related transcriptional regulator n=1 Tax=Streptomyces sp. NPDC005283 TaxID=3156871 RepID=UPI0034531DDB